MCCFELTDLTPSSTLDMPTIIDCNVEFGHLTDYSNVYECQPGCDTQTVIGTADGEYSAFSRICSSAIHCGIHGRKGGLISIKPSTTPNTYTATLANKIWSKEGAAAPSFIIRKVASEADAEWCSPDSTPLVPINVTASSYLKHFTETSGMESVSTYLNWNPTQAVSSSISPWAPDISDTASPWLEVDLGPSVHTITKLITYSSQIRYFDFRTENFTMAVQVDNEWEMVLDGNTVRTFLAAGQPSYHHFPVPIQTTKFRIYPLSAAASPVPALKLSIFGCKNEIVSLEGKTH